VTISGSSEPPPVIDDSRVCSDTTGDKDLGVVDSASAAKSLVSNESFLLVDKVYTASGSVITEKSFCEPISVVKHAPEISLAEVSYSAGMTMNLGNYESCKVSVSVKLPCYIEEIPFAYQTAKTFVDTKLSAEVVPIREAAKHSRG
jgi:hypothetical protein